MKPPLLLFVFILIVQTASAQFQFTPLGGINISKVHFSNNASTEVSYSNIFGPMFGVNAKYITADRFNVQLESAFSQKGYGIENNTLPDRVTFKINYLDVLALGEYSINPKIHLNFGGNLGIKINHEIAGDKGSSPEIYNGLDIGMIGGLKFHIKRFFIRTIYQYGINSIDAVVLTDENGQQTGQSNMYNRTFQMAMGYTF